MFPSTYASYQLNVNEVFPRQAIYGFQLAPDEQQLSFILQRDKQVKEVFEEDGKKIEEICLADIYLIPCIGGYPRQLTNSGDVSKPGIWSPEGEWLVFACDKGLCITSSITGETKIIYKGKLYHPLLDLGDAHLGYPRWSPDSNFILFTRREELQTTLSLVSKDGRLLRELFSIEGHIIGWDWSRDGRRIAIVTCSEDGWRGDIRLLDLETERVCILWQEENYAYQTPIAIWMPDSQHIVFRSNRSGWSKLWIANTSNGEFKAVTSGNWDDYTCRLSPDGKQLVYASRAEQNGSGDDLWIVSLADGAPKRLTHHAGVNVPLAWSKDNRIYYWHTSPLESGDLWVISTDSKESRGLTWSTSIALERKLRAPEEVLITHLDDTQVPALIYLPVYYQDGQQYPAIVWIRGGPTSMCRYEFQPFYNWLANQGYVVISPNYRGSIGYGVEHMSAVVGEGLGKNDLRDVLAAGKYVRSLAYVDGTRGIGVGGHSWGGYLALMAVSEAPDDFSCAVAGAAISDWFTQQAQTDTRNYDYWLMDGWVYELEKRALERSPISLVECIKVPLLIYHGEEDRNVPFAQTRAFVEKAQRAGVKVECVSYPMEGHGNKKMENLQDIQDRIRSFYRRYLQPWNFRDNPCANQA